MKLRLETSLEYNETEVYIQCQKVDNKIQKIIDIVNDDTKRMTVKKEGVSEMIKIQDIYYFESVDERSYVYAETEVYSTEKKLYEIEELLKESSFVRISKSCILNIDHLDGVKMLRNGKLEAQLSNGERLIINRHYVPSFKQKLS